MVERVVRLICAWRLANRSLCQNLMTHNWITGQNAVEASAGSTEFHSVDEGSAFFLLLRIMYLMSHISFLSWPCLHDGIPLFSFRIEHTHNLQKFTEFLSSTLQVMDRDEVLERDTRFVKGF